MGKGSKEPDKPVVLDMIINFKGLLKLISGIVRYFSIFTREFNLPFQSHLTLMLGIALIITEQMLPTCKLANT